MKTDAFYDTLRCELERQIKLHDEYKRKLATAIDGYLYIRENKHSKTYYQVIPSGSSRRRINISTQPHIIKELLNKVMLKKSIPVIQKNIKTLQLALKGYQSLLPLENFNPIHKEVFLEIHKKLSHDYFHKAPYDPQFHIHETVCGEMVRSKAEVIIVNALWHYEIPFNYEELFPHTDDDGNWFYPDFTIHCPDGSVIIWEHLGLLSKLDYCIHNAGKLHTYHENNYVIGKNLIITQDDKYGNCSTILAYHIIENYILPHFK